MHDDDTRSTERNWMPWENTAVVDDDTADDPTTATTTVMAPRRFLLTWQQGAALASAGLIAFLGMSQFLGPHPQVRVSVPATTNKAEANSVSLHETAGAKDFPADAATTCSEGDHEVPNPHAATVRKLSSSGTSCGFLEETEAHVLAHIASVPPGKSETAVEHFTVPAVSLATGHQYDLTCERAAHLTYCTGGNNAAMYIKDTLPS